MPNPTSYYHVDILRLDEENEPTVFEYELCGWIYQVSTLDDGKDYSTATIAAHSCY